MGPGQNMTWEFRKIDVACARGTAGRTDPGIALPEGRGRRAAPGRGWDGAAVSRNWECWLLRTCEAERAWFCLAGLAWSRGLSVRNYAWSGLTQPTNLSIFFFGDYQPKYLLRPIRHCLAASAGPTISLTHRRRQSRRLRGASTSPQLSRSHGRSLLPPSGARSDLATKKSPGTFPFRGFLPLADEASSER
jgi:hypothetical protein